MDTRQWMLAPVAVALAVVFVWAASSATKPPALGTEIAPALAAAPARPQTSELEVSLFVQDPHFKNGKKAIHLIWIPQPVLKYCLGKTSEQCSTIDFCIRTTSKQVKMCQNLSVDATHLPPYPPDTTPRRVLSIVFFFPMTDEKGFSKLAEFFENAPKGSLDHLSRSARIRARVKLTRKADDDDFDVLEILGAPSS